MPMRLPDISMAKIRILVSKLAGAAGLAFALSCGPAQAIEATVTQPRPFGYSIGDVVEQTIFIRSASGETLEPESLPKTGRIGAWMERTRAELTHQSNGYRLDLVYQFINSPTEIRTLGLPQIKLQFHVGKQIVEETVGEWPVTLAPLTPLTVLARAGLDEMRPDALPHLIDERPYTERLTGYAIGLGVLALLWLGWYAGVTLRGRRPRPFAHAWRGLRRSAKSAPDAQGYRDALRRLHRAFDTTAGTTVFAERLDPFFASHPSFAPARPAIEGFFADSRMSFFGARGDEQDWTAKWAALLALAGQLRVLEREAG